MTLYDFLRKLVGVYQPIIVLDLSREDEAGAQTIYSGLCWKCPYTEEQYQNDPISQKLVDSVEAEEDTLIVSVGILAE